MHNSKNEIEQFIYKYLTNRSVKILCPCEINKIKVKIDENEVFHFLKHLQSFEEPDGFSLIGNTVMIFEHFEFDASKNTKKGSALQKELANNQKLTEKLLNDAEIKEFVLADNSRCQYKESHTEIKVSSEIKFYIDNLVKQFTNHCSKRNNYEMNIKTKLKNDNLIFKECFLIEDKNNFIPHDEDNNSFNICLTKEFISVWKMHPEIEYIILGVEKTCYVLSNELLKIKDFDSLFDLKFLLHNSAQVINSIVYLKKPLD